MCKNDNDLENEKFNETINNYVELLDSQKNSFNVIMYSLVMRVKACDSKIDKFLKKHNVTLTQDPENENLSTFSIPPHLHSNFQMLVNDLSSSSMALQLTPPNMVVAMVSIFDSFVGNLIKAIFTAKPTLLKSCEKDFFKSCEKDSSEFGILEFSSIDEIKDFIINKEIENVLRGSHTKQFEWLSTKLNVKLTEDLPHFIDFIEITERRNLFVHSNGRVSKQYLKICNENGAIIDNGLKEGDKLTANGNYVIHAYNILYEIGVKLGQVIWRKMNIGLEKCDNCLQDITFNLINNKQYELASILLDFSTKRYVKHFDKEFELVFIFNKALSYYLQDNKQACNDIIINLDCSAYDYKYKLAKATLLEEYEKASKIMISMGSKEEHKINYRTWPLFRKFRETDLFKNTYQEIFGIPFEYEEIEPTGWQDVVNESHEYIQQLKENDKLELSKEQNNQNELFN